LERLLIGVLMVPFWRKASNSQSATPFADVDVDMAA
jgi:hypothetical protein